MSKNCDKAIAILRATNDGDDLEPKHLKLVEDAVNGFLNEYGQKVFDHLHKVVVGGHYEKPWFHGIEHLTIDNVGYVYWKGQRFEHYEMRFAYSSRGRDAAVRDAAKCQHLESLGVPINATTVVWQWEKYQNMQLAALA